MDKDKKSVFDFRLLKNFFTVRFNIWVIVSSIILSLCIYLYSLSFHQVTIFPRNNDFIVDFYTDSANGGNSIILYQNISDSTIDLDYKLKEGFIAPYVGINITNKNDSVFNFTQYNRLHFDVAGEQVKSISISIYTGSTGAGIKEVCFYENFDITSERKQYVIDLDELKVADWWYALNNIPADERFHPDLKYIYRITIGPAYTSASDVRHSLQIYSISFERDNAHLILLLISAELILMFFLGVAHYIRAYKTQPVTITYKPVDVENENRHLNSFLHYINNNFHDSRLTLSRVSSQTGINQRRIAASIQRTFGCNFKTYINRLRINESKRLLIESKLHMGEIAFKVGFNNQTHFNRVFKSFEGISPSEFLQNNQR